MRKHFLLFMALFALAGLNSMFAAGGEASDHTTTNVYNPENQNLKALSLPISINSIATANVDSTVWFPAQVDNLVYWDPKEGTNGAMIFTGSDRNSSVTDQTEHPFIIKLSEAAKQIFVDLKRPTSVTTDNDGGGFRIFEWDGSTKTWIKIKDTNGWHNPASTDANISSSSRYLMIASYNHAGATRKLYQLDVTSLATLTPDMTALAFKNNTAQTIVVSNSKTSVLPSVSWQVNTDKFSYSTTQTGDAESGTTTITVTPEAGAVAGDIATLTITAGTQHLEIPVVYYNNNSVPLDLTSNGSVYDAARFIGMCTFDKAHYDFGTKSIVFESQSSKDNTRSVIVQFTDAPLRFSYSIQANQESAGWSSNQPKISTFESEDGTNWTIKENAVQFNGLRNSSTISLSGTSRYIKFEFVNIQGIGTLTKLNIEKLDPNPSFTMPVDELNWGTVAVGKIIPTADVAELAGKLTAGNLNPAALISTWNAAITGADANQFILASPEPANGACEVSFKPTSSGIKTATLTLTAKNTTSNNEQCIKTVTLTGTGDAAIVVEISKNKAVPANKDFGTIIGTNSASEVYDVFYNGSNTLEAKIVNSAQDHTISPHFSVSYNAGKATVTAHKNVAVDAELVASACLAIGESTAQDPVYAYLPLTATYEPKNTTGFTWNISESLVEDYFYKNIYTATTDAAITVSVGNNNQYLSYANSKLTTGVIESSPQAAGSIIVTAPATNSYVAINETLNVSLTARVKGLPLDLSSSDDWNRFQYMICDGSTHASYNTSNGKITMDQNNNGTSKYLIFKFSGTPDSIKYTATMSKSGSSTPRLYLKESSNGINWTDIVTTDGDNSKFTGTKTISFKLLSTTKYVQFEYKNGNCEITNLKVTTLEPTVTLAKSSVVLKNNKTVVNDATVQFSVLKYAAIKAAVDNTTDFGLVKGASAAADTITFTGDDGLNATTFTNCTFKVRYKGGDIANATGKSATITFYDGENNPIANKQVAVSVIDMPVLTFEKPTNGSYTYKYGEEAAVTVNTADVTRELAQEPYEVTLTATPDDGYKFFAWYEKNGDTKTYLSTSATYTPSISTTKTIGAEFVTSTTPVFIVKGQDGAYLNLNDACTAAQSSDSKVVVLTSNGTLAAGNYTIPSTVTLLIPMDANYETQTKAASDYSNSTAPEVFGKLTFSANTNVTVYGSICLAAVQKAQTNGHPCSPGSVMTKYGAIDMKTGGNITVKNGGHLYVFGFIFGTGDQSTTGTIEVESGGVVCENIVLTDMHGGSATNKIIYNSGYGTPYSNAYEVFPFHQYYIQNIEPKITVNYGGKINALFNIESQGIISGHTQEYLTLIGSSNDSFIKMAQGSIVTKWYDATFDRQCYSVQGEATLNDLSIYATQSVEISSKNFILPITNNFDITILSGSIINVPYKSKMLPGSKLTIAEGAIVNILNELYVYDDNEWGNFAFSGYIRPLSSTYDPGVVYVRPKANKSDLGDATIEVNGTLNVIDDGVIYTTQTGASIVSTGAGQIILNGATPEADKKVYEIDGTNGSDKAPQIHMNNGAYVTPINCTPAQLRNGDDTYTPTADVAANTTFVYNNGQWLVKKTMTTIEVNENKVEIGDQEEDIQEHTYQVKSGDQVEATQVTINEGAKIEVNENASLDVADTIKVTEGSTLEVETTASVSANTLALSTTPAAINLPDQGQGTAGTSSQIKGAGTITAQNVFIDITMDPTGTLDGSKYYAFAVPFNVNVNGGVQMFKNNAWVTCTHDTHYRAYTYNGQNRADHGKGSNWVKVANNSTFQPGVFYLVEFADGSANVFRFTKATGEDLNNAANITLDEFASSTSTDAGWNGIANNSLQNASISLSSTGIVQVYDPVNKTFVTIMDLGNTVFAIGTPMFIQAAGAGVTATNSAVQTPSAPARMLAQTDDETFGNYTIRIKAEGATKMADQMFISASENAENNYVIGKDLVKMFMGNASVAQLWVNDYGKKLSVSQAVLVDNVANASLTLYAPKAGNYTVYLKDIPEDATIYLLENGKAVATLNDGAFSVALAKGENTQYGLRINAIRTIPGIITSIDEALVGGDIQKVLLDGVVYIVRDGKLFTVLGQER